MLKEFAWKTFEDTGGIDSYLFYRNLEDLYHAENKGTEVFEEVLLARDSGA